MKTLLNVPDLIEALKPLVEEQVTARDVFSMIGSGEIRPYGVVQRMPIFGLTQIGEIAAAINNSIHAGGTKER